MNYDGDGGLHVWFQTVLILLIEETEQWRRMLCVSVPTFNLFKHPTLSVITVSIKAPKKKQKNKKNTWSLSANYNLQLDLTIYHPGKNKQLNDFQQRPKIITTWHKEYSVTLVLADSDYVLLAQKGAEYSPVYSGWIKQSYGEWIMVSGVDVLQSTSFLLYQWGGWAAINLTQSFITFLYPAAHSIRLLSHSVHCSLDVVIHLLCWWYLCTFSYLQYRLCL